MFMSAIPVRCLILISQRIHRGHGKSWPPPQNGTVEQLAQDVLAITDAERLDKFYVGGHSIGGMIAKEVGWQWPQKVEGVISIEGWTHWTVEKNAFGHAKRNTLTKEEEQQRLDGRKRGAGHWSEEQREDFAKIWRKWERGNEFVSTTSIPVLEMYGDRGTQKATREQLQIPDRDNITLLWINNASHSLPLEEPIAVGNAITDFIRQNEKTNN